MKKALLIASLAFTGALILTSCRTQSGSNSGTPTSTTHYDHTTNVSTERGDEQTVIDKLYQIESDWTEQQVHDLLGPPDEYGQASVVVQDYYNISETKRATISYWGEGVQVEIYDFEAKENIVILETFAE